MRHTLPLSLFLSPFSTLYSNLPEMAVIFALFLLKLLPIVILETNNLVIFSLLRSQFAKWSFLICANIVVAIMIVAFV